MKVKDAQKWLPKLVGRQLLFKMHVCVCVRMYRLISWGKGREVLK